MNNVIIFLDIDGTLLDENYKYNDATLKSNIIRLQNKGTVFCLNSNRSLEDLIPVAKRFSIEGLLIAENGIFALDTRTQETRYFVKQSRLRKFETDKTICDQKMFNTLKKFFEEDKMMWVNTDTVNALNNKSELNSNVVRFIALNNIYRRYTSSIHILECTKHKVEPINFNKLKSITNEVQNTLGQDCFSVSYSSKFSNILICPREVSKRLAVCEVLNKYKNIKHTFAIGDEINDYKMVKGVGKFCAVGNASTNVKKLACFTAKNSYTKGVSESLKYIEKQLCAAF